MQREMEVYMDVVCAQGLFVGVSLVDVEGGLMVLKILGCDDAGVVGVG